MYFIKPPRAQEEIASVSNEEVDLHINLSFSLWGGSLSSVSGQMSCWCFTLRIFLLTSVFITNSVCVYFGTVQLFHSLLLQWTLLHIVPPAAHSDEEVVVKICVPAESLCLRPAHRAADMSLNYWPNSELLFWSYLPQPRLDYGKMMEVGCKALSVSVYSAAVNSLLLFIHYANKHAFTEESVFRLINCISIFTVARNVLVCL